MSAACVASEIPRGPLPPDVQPLHYTLQLRVVPDEERFSGLVRIKLHIAKPVERIWLHGRDLNVEHVHIEAADSRRVTAEYRQRTDDGVAELRFGRQLPAGVATVELRYSAAFNQRMLGLFKVVESERSYAFTLFPQIEARRAFPGFDEPRFKTPFDMTIVTRGDHDVIANAPVVRESMIDGGLKRVEFATTARLPTSLLALAVGDLDVVSAEPIPVSAVRKHEVPLRGIAAHGKGPYLTYALRNTAAVVTALEEYFGVPYPYQKLDLIAVPMWGGASENAAAITYAEKYLLIKEDASAAQRQSFANVHAHELAHQWFGNLVTPAWWDDLWLNESFASWLGNRIAGAAADESLAARESLRDGLAAMNTDSRSHSLPLRRRIDTTEDFAGGFSPLIYGKGAAVLTMLESFAGEARFREGIRLYVRRFHDGVTTGAGFLEALAEGAKVPDLAPVFVSFLDQPGVPLVELDWRCRAGRLQIDLAQSRYFPLASPGDARGAWTLPVCVSLDGGQQHCTILKEAKQSWTVAVDQCPAVLMPNADGAGYYRFSLPRQRMLELARRLDRLNAREALSLLDSLAAELMAGRLSVDDYLVALGGSAAHPAADVVVAPLPTVKFILRHLTDEHRRPALRQRLIELYTASAQRALASEGDEASLLRSTLLPFLALELRDATTRTSLARQGRTALSGADTTAAIPQDVLPTALAVAVQEEGQQALERLWARFTSSTDMVFRRSVLTAFANVDDPLHGRWIREKLLAPQVGENEAVDLLVEHTQAPGNLADAWDWLRLHFDELASRVPAWRRDKLIGVTAGFCTEKERREVAGALRTAAAGIEGGSAALGDALEQVDTCVALARRRLPGAEARPLQ